MVGTRLSWTSCLVLLAVTPGEGLVHVVKDKPWPSRKQMRDKRLFKMPDDKVRRSHFNIDWNTSFHLHWLLWRDFSLGYKEWDYPAQSGLSILSSPLRTGLGGRVILHTGHHPHGLNASPLEHRRKMNQMQLAGDSVFSPVTLTRGGLTLHGQKPDSCQQKICLKTRATSSGWQTTLHVCPRAQQ